MISRTQLLKEIKRIKEINKEHNSRYFIGYEDALRFVHTKMKQEKKI